MSTLDLSVRELDTPYSNRPTSTSVATPSCCCCCCCCLTALIVGDVYIGTDIQTTAISHGRKRTWIAVAASLVLPITLPFGLLAFAGDDVYITLIWLLTWVMVASGLLAVARWRAGDTPQRAANWGLVVTMIWTALMAVNFALAFPVWFGTAGIGMLIEIALIPYWIVLIVRRARRQRAAAVTNSTDSTGSTIPGSTAPKVAPPGSTPRRNPPDPGQHDR